MAAIELLGALLLVVVVLRATWLASHPAAHHAIQRQGYWSSRTDRVLQHVAHHPHG